ncbi:acyl-CoA dehydrogenase family protein, partial [Streptomyces fradiae]|uniref:acyl-CoA dehydrogenase family protein n=1 Tax=Streptomyces fradiae TaxID=1906 RepID=UPI0034291391
LGAEGMPRRYADYLAADGFTALNTMTKMKVTTEGEKVVDLMWDVIAAKGFEKDTYFAQAAAEIRSLPKLEGTVHVNLALILKFMRNHLLDPVAYEPVPARPDAADDDFLFRQGPARGLGSIRFHDWRPAFDAYGHLPNVGRFREQADALCAFVATAAPDEVQSRDLDLLLAVGQLFALVVHGQLILEQAALRGLDEDVLDELFTVLVRDFSGYAVELHGKDSATAEQQRWALDAVRRPVVDAARSERVWQRVEALSGAYEMTP